MSKLKRRFVCWNRWRKIRSGNIFYKILVLIGLANSPSFTFYMNCMIGLAKYREAANWPYNETKPREKYILYYRPKGYYILLGGYYYD